jgi:hypothetical protein
LTVLHTGLNDPLAVALNGVGGVTGASAAISFQPRSLAFPPLHVGNVSKKWRVTISNAGGNLPLAVQNVSLGGANSSSFTILDNRCPQQVDAGASCLVDVAFSPQTAGALSASLVVDDNAPGGTHSLPLAGTGSTADPAVSATVDGDNGYPQWYGDANGVRLGQCLDPADTNCVVLPDAGFTPTKPVSFPTNFPSEWFYGLADSDQISLPGCPAAGIGAGTALLRVALEGAFSNGTPAAGDQITFGRLRISATGGLCPGAGYVFETPYGTVPFTADAAGGIARTVGTEDIGCGPVAPATCSFSDALGSRIAKSFPRWDPASAPAAPDGYLGDAKTLHTITGGTFVPVGSSQPVNSAAVLDVAGNVIGQTDKFLVSGRLAGPLVGDVPSIDFGHQPTGQTGGNRTVKVTNVATTATTVSALAVTGVNADQFAVVPGSTCTGSLASDATCSVQVTFSPSSAGTKNATLRITPATGPALLVPLSGVGDAAAAPVAKVTPGVLAFGTTVAPGSATLSTTVQNTGNAPLVVGTPAITGAAAGDYGVTTPDCGSIAPAGTCTVTVKFTPTNIGSRTATMTIPHNAVGGSTAVSLTGTGSGSQFTLSPTAVKFGTVNRGSTATSTVTVKNSGTLSFRVGTATAATTGSATNVFSVVNNGTGCVGTILAAGKTCSITVRYAPTAAVTSNGVLTVAGDATSLPATASASLTGTGK